MQPMPVTTTMDPAGAVHAIAISPQHIVLFVPPSVFDRLAPGCDTTHAGTLYKVAARHEIGGTSIFVANATPPLAASIDRDDAWRRRLELASVLPRLVNGAPGIDPAMLRRQLPVALLVPSYQEYVRIRAGPARALTRWTRVDGSRSIQSEASTSQPRPGSAILGESGLRRRSSRSSVPMKTARRLPSRR